MRVVVDTNVLVAGLISSSSAPRRIVDALLHGEVVPVVSPATLTELEQVLRRPKIRRYLTDADVTVATFLADFIEVAELVQRRPSGASLRRIPRAQRGSIAASRWV